MLEEVWKDIKDYEGYYQVSNLGNIKSLDRYVDHYCRFNGKITPMLRKGRPRKIGSSPNGYSVICLRKLGNHPSHRSVHRVVCEAFIPNPSNLPQINHIDGNKKNNIVSNLEWCTPSENQFHAIRNGLTSSKIGESAPRAKLKEIEVLQIKEMLKTNKAYTQISSQFKVTPGNIYRIDKKLSWKHL